MGVFRHQGLLLKVAPSYRLYERVPIVLDMSLLHDAVNPNRFKAFASGSLQSLHGKQGDCYCNDCTKLKVQLGLTLNPLLKPET